MKRLGQHFLKNRSALQKMAEALDLRSGDIVIEIGAGHGELTKELRMKNEELRIVAIEKDNGLAEGLKQKFSDDKNIEVILGDALKEFPSFIHNSLFLIHGYKVCGNIPYYITGRLLRILSELENKPSVCVFTLQKEVAERICAVPRGRETTLRGKPPGMNRLAAITQFWAEPKVLFSVPRNDFSPPPEVDSAVVKLESRVVSRESGFIEKYYKTVKILFAQPRKTILNNVSHITYHVSRETLAEKLISIGINPQDRPQNLDIEEIIKITKLL